MSNSFVIQEFRTRGPNGALDEFIEIRNIAPYSLSLTGAAIVMSDANGVGTVVSNLPSVQILSGCTYLLANTQAGGSSGAADQRFSVDLPDDGGIALLHNGTADQVGMSSGSTYGEGTRLSPLPATALNQSYDRVARDSDSNADDFQLSSAPTPTPAPSPGTTCSLPPFGRTLPGLLITSTNTSVGVGGTITFSAKALPGDNPLSTGLAVTANLLAIGGGATVPLYDDGTHGDVHPNDRSFALAYLVPAGVSSGNKQVSLTVSDDQGRSVTYTVVITVGPTLPSFTSAILPFRRSASNRLTVSVVPGQNPVSTGLQATLDLSRFGLSAQTPLSDAGGGACDQVAGDLTFSACLYVFAQQEIALFTLFGSLTDAQGRSQPLLFPGVTVSDLPDGDADGLANACEETFGISTSSANANDGPAGDPDNDGLSNAAECAAGSHPRGLHRRYLAEGVTNDFFKTRLALFNPTAAPAYAFVRFQPEGLPERSFATLLPAGARRTVMPEDTRVFGSAPFATLIESDAEIVVDRTMSWGDTSYGSHLETALHAPATTWHLAEGATGWRFSLFYLLQNPSAQGAEIEVSYRRGPGEPVLTRTYQVEPRQRRTVWVDEEEFPAGSGIKPLASTDVSARIQVTNGVPIIVERAMYMSPDDQPFAAGHGGAAIATPATSWFFAEGSTGELFDEFLLIANPGTDPAAITITFVPQGGAPMPRNYSVPPESRLTVRVDDVPGLENVSLSATVTSSLPVLAERAMWWPGTGESWREAHVSAGATSGAARWAVADLEVGGPNNAQSFLLVYGGGTVMIHFDDGTAPVSCGTTGPGRATIQVSGCPGVSGKRFVSAVVNGNANTVVERATYASPGGRTFSAGGAALGTAVP